MKTILLAVMSLDGRITRHQTQGDGFGSEAEKMRFRQTLRGCDCCIMGRRTYEQSKVFFRIDSFPGMRRLVLTGKPELYKDEAVPGRLEFTCATPEAVIRELVEEGRQTCALLGGAHVYGQFLHKGLVDELQLTVEPRIFGEGKNLTEGIAMDVKLELLNCERLGSGESLLLTYLLRR